MNDRPKHRPISEAFARQERERLADIEAAYQRAAWSLTTAQAADLAKVNPYPFDGVRISGNHRPRHGRLYARGSDDGER